MDAATLHRLRTAALQRRVRAAARACLAEEILALQAMLAGLDEEAAGNPVPGSSHLT